MCIHFTHLDALKSTHFVSKLYYYNIIIENINMHRTDIDTFFSLLTLSMPHEPPGDSYNK